MIEKYSAAKKFRNHLHCEFFKMVVIEPGSSVLSSIEFLHRHPLYDVEKVYEHRRKDWPHVPPTNAIMHRVESIPIQNIRGMHCSLSDQGFYYMKLKTHLQADDFQDTTVLAEQYLPQLTEAVRKSLGAARIQAYDIAVRA